MFTLSLADYAAFASVVGIPLGAGVVVLRAILSRVDAIASAQGELKERQAADHSELKRRMDNAEDRIEAINRDKMSKTDAVRENLNMREKVDLLTSSIARMEGKLDSTLGTAGAVDRLAEAVQTFAERTHG